MMNIRNLLPGAGQSAQRDSDQPFYSLQNQMNSLFDDFFSGFGRTARSAGTGGFGSIIPPVDVKENDGEFTIRAELPGVEENDIDVTVTKDAVTIKGEKREEKEDKGKSCYYMERSYGSFSRVIPLTAETDADKAQASFKNGVLSITLPKSVLDKTRGTKVSIQSK
jgi:HSP20 family protein